MAVHRILLTKGLHSLAIFFYKTQNIYFSDTSTVCFMQQMAILMREKVKFKVKCTEEVHYVIIKGQSMKSILHL